MQMVIDNTKNLKTDISKVNIFNEENYINNTNNRLYSNAKNMPEA